MNPTTATRARRMIVGVELLALVQHDLHGTDPSHQQTKTHIVHGNLAGGGIVVNQHSVGEDPDKGCHGDVDQEDPAPMQII